MDSMDNFRERFEALAQQMEQWKHQTQILKPIPARSNGGCAE